MLHISPHTRSWIEIDTHALRHNFAEITRLAPDVQIMCALKADAYGHGAVECARVFESANMFAVATVPEAIELRVAGVRTPILILRAITDKEEVDVAIRYGLTLTVASVEHGVQLGRFAADLGQFLQVHVKYDTGMHRLGLPLQDIRGDFRIIQSQTHLQITGVYSHFATADDPDESFAREQLRAFENIRNTLLASDIPSALVFHLANSGGILLGKETHFDFVRPGLMLYGYLPDPRFASRVSLIPALSVKSRITHIFTAHIGESVSYGRRWYAQRESRIATLPIGYADGIPRALTNQMEVIICGKKCPQVGTITMDQIMVDITDIPESRVGDIAVLIGVDRDQKITADDWAVNLATISYEVLCGFKKRLPRIFL